MLPVPAEFPQVGSTGYLAGTGQPARILRRNADKTCLIELRDTRSWGTARRHGSSANTTVPASDLFATAQEATAPAQPRRRRSRKAK